MKRKTTLLTLSLLVLGCATIPPMTPKEHFQATQKAFLATIQTLKILKDADKFTGAEVIRIGNLIRAGDRAMDLWYEALQEGQTNINAIDALEAILEELIAYQKKGEGNVE